MTFKYEKTHPWIDFSVDTRKASIDTWMLLGEAQSKCEHIAGALLDPATAKKFHGVYLAKGARATTAIEGNTLTEEQVRLLMSGELEVPKSKEYMRTEVDNILKACNDIADTHFADEGQVLSVEEIKKYNQWVLTDLPQKDGVIPGEIRKYSVGVGRYQGAPAEDCFYLLKKMCEMLETNFSLGSGWSVASGILKAIVAHLYIAWIHPFGDGNGRTARLVEFKLCIAFGVPSPAAHLLSNHYNETRDAYYLALDQTSKERSPFPFIFYALQGYVDQLREQIIEIRRIQHKAFWINFVHSVYQELDSQANKRRRDLILDISEKTFGNSEWIPIADVENISGKIRAMYAGKTSKAKIRDINALVERSLIKRKKKSIRPNFELIEAYRSRQVK